MIKRILITMTVSFSLLLTACDINKKYNDQQPINKLKVEINSRERNYTKYIEVDKEKSNEELLQEIIDIISVECFNGLPIKAKVYPNNIAKIELLDPQNEKEHISSWEKDYLNNQTIDYTINTIIKNIIQNDYKGKWIEKIQIYYKENLIQIN